MALIPIVFTEKFVRSFLRYQLTAYPFADARLLAQVRRLLSLDWTRQSPLLKELSENQWSQPFRTVPTVSPYRHPGCRHRVAFDLDEQGLCGAGNQVRVDLQ